MTPASCWLALGTFAGYRVAAVIEDVWFAWRAMDDDPSHLDDDDELAA